jgi:hypothetical protein
MKFLASYTVITGRSLKGETKVRRIEVATGSVVPLDEEARALSPERRTEAVRAILLGQITGEVQQILN